VNKVAAHIVIDAAKMYVREYMSAYDPSHDYDHITRVEALAKSILRAEENASRLQSSNANHDRVDERNGKPVPRLSEETVILGALLHDVKDRKYLDQHQSPVNLAGLLEGWGADQQLAGRVHRLCHGVSYSTEVRDPKLVQDLIEEIPELAVVQDADRLDALGAVGIGRCFIFGGVRGRPMSDSVGHFDDKLLHLSGLMKTRTGREMAQARTDRIKEFVKWWNDETCTSEADK
jgi:uncharacterized protein